MKNHWCTHSDAFATWYITFPPVSQATDIDNLLEFAQHLLEVGEREQIYRVLETRSPNAFKATANYTYIQYLRDIAASESQRLPLFNDGGGAATTERGTLRAPARICFYNQMGNLVEQEIENVGLLLKELRPDAVELCSYKHIKQVEPVSVIGPNLSLSIVRDTSKLWPVRIRISLFCDIWFSLVGGYLDLEKEVHFFDNRELACCHTPRLNRFISNVRQLTLSFGGSWKVGDVEVSKLYKNRITEDGITLEG